MSETVDHAVTEQVIRAFVSGQNLGFYQGYVSAHSEFGESIVALHALHANELLSVDETSTDKTITETLAEMTTTKKPLRILSVEGKEAESHESIDWLDFNSYLPDQSDIDIDSSIEMYFRSEHGDCSTS